MDDVADGQLLSRPWQPAQMAGNIRVGPARLAARCSKGLLDSSSPIPALPDLDHLPVLVEGDDERFAAALAEGGHLGIAPDPDDVAGGCVLADGSFLTSHFSILNSRLFH